MELNDMRRPFIAGNWKMFTSEAEAIALAQAILDMTRPGDYDVAVCPPSVHLSSIRDVLEGSHVAIGAQDVYWESFGAYTGEVSVPMLETYCKYVIIGHSERRQLFGETNEAVNKKLLAVLNSSLLPIVAIGETEEQRTNNETETVLARQILEGFAGITLSEQVTVAYEPVWAIGTGLTPTPEEAQSACAFIREILSQIDSKTASVMRILYGGSVKPSNAGDLLKNPDIDGALVGGASLDAGQFVDIINALP
jgi:triosephosphate isomerase